MKTAHSMLKAGARTGPWVGLLVIALGAAGCTKQVTLVPPQTLTAPYADEVVWGVAPLVNESGVGIVDELSATDALVEQITQVEGVSALPTNRTIAAMRALDMGAVRSPSDARLLADALGVDAIVVGSITTWYPYDPCRLGMSLALIARTESGRAFDPSDVDPLLLSQGVTDSGIDVRDVREVPVTAVSAVYDGANHGVIADVREYATGRYDPRSALDEELYVKSMERFTEFVCFRMVESVLERERRRLTVAEAAE